MKRIVVACIAVALVALTMAYRILPMGGPLGGFENDQFVTLSQAQQIVLGEWPTRDFVSLGKYLTIAFSALGQALFGQTLFAEAITTSALIGISTAVLFVLGWRATGSVAIPLLVALLQIAMAPRFYNHSKLIAYAFAIPTLWWYIDLPTRGRLALMALAGVVAFLLRHDHGVYVGLTAILTVALVWRPHGRRIVTEVALLGAFALLMVSPFLVFVQLNRGVVSYFDNFVRYATNTAGRTNRRDLQLSFDLRQPLAVHLPQAEQRPRINVRWQRGLSAAERTARARELGLLAPQPLRDEVVNYALSDASPQRLAAIVRNPAVADTNGIDRQAFVLNDPAYTHMPSWWERTTAFVRSVRILPGILRRENAVPFLYYLMYAVPVVAFLVAFRRPEDASARWPHGAVKIIVVAVLTLLIDRAFLRGNITSRLADVTEPVGILAAWLAAMAVARRSRRARRAAIAAAVLVFVLAAISVETIENVSGQLSQAGITSGRMRRQAAAVHELLGATPPIDAWPADTQGIEAAARYIRWCTAPDDRVLVVGYFPELYFMAKRRFAAGQMWMLPDFFNAPEHEELMLQRFEPYRVPIVLTVPDPEYSREYVPDFPAVTGMLANKYQDTGTVDFGRGFRFRVLVRRDLTPTGVYPLHQMPCFS